MRRQRRKNYVDRHEEMLNAMEWEQTEIDSRRAMSGFEDLPPLVKLVVAETGVDCVDALGHYRDFLKCNSPVEADRKAAAHIRKLVYDWVEAEISQAVRELQSAGKALSARLRR